MLEKLSKFFKNANNQRYRTPCRKIIRAVKRPKLLVGNIISSRFLRLMPDILYLKIMYNLKMGKALNLRNPLYFNEKLQWLKLSNRNPQYSRLVDKYEVRTHIAETIGDKYLVKLIGVWDKFEDIDFTLLPDRFVLKCTHDSGSAILCRDKMNFDVEAARAKINRLLARNFYYSGREWPYKFIKPRILCEEFIQTENNSVPVDYKFHCFNGVPDNVMVCMERESGQTKFCYFNEQWDVLEYGLSSTAALDLTLFKLGRPSKLNEMFEIAKTLSVGMPFVRVDLYCEDEHVYFGELTFFPQSGFDNDLQEETDLLFGNKLELNRNIFNGSYI